MYTVEWKLDKNFNAKTLIGVPSLMVIADVVLVLPWWICPKAPIALIGFCKTLINADLETWYLEAILSIKAAFSGLIFCVFWLILIN